MRWSLIALVGAFVLAVPASAIRLGLHTDRDVYEVGESIVVTLFGDTTGAPNALVVFVEVGYDDTLVTEPVSSSQTGITSFGGALRWSVGFSPCRPSACPVFNQLGGLSIQIPDPDIEIGRLVLTAAAPGMLALTITKDFSWFETDPPPDVTVTIVPEPGTLTTLAVGLLALALARRRPARRAGLIVLLAAGAAGEARGDGLFARAFRVGDLPRAVAVADLDDDGVLDLVSADSHSDDVSVLLGKGDGSFQSAVRFAAGFHPYDVSVADLDADGAMDLVTANAFGGDVSVLLGYGDGSFRDALSFPVGFVPVSLAVADLDGDAIPDLATANLGSNDVSVLIGRGDGSFAGPVSFAAGAKPQDVAVADLDGDGVPDLITANGDSEDLSVLRGNGDGSFAPAVPWPAGVYPYAVAVGDLDGDHIPDLVAANAHGRDLTVRLGNGDGSFQNANTVSVHDGSPYALAIADLDADGRPDLVVGNGGGRTVDVLLGNGDGSFGEPTSYATRTTGGRTGSLAGLFSVATGDLDGDGILDIVAANVDSNDLVLLLGQGDGSFEVSGGRAQEAGDGPVALAAADLDGDRVVDLVTANGLGHDVSVLLGTGEGAFAPAEAVPVGLRPSGIVVADFDGDARLDLATSNAAGHEVSVLPGNGDGSFGTARSYPTGAAAAAIAAGDLNGDSFIDLVTAHPSLERVAVLLANGSGGFGPRLQAAGGAAVALALADLDGDAVLDVVTGNGGDGTLSVLLGKGDGNLQAPLVLSTGDPSIVWSVAVARLDGDEVPDLVASTTFERSVAVLLGHGDGSFAEATRFPGDPVSFSTGALAVADIDLDGIEDVVVAHPSSGDFSVFRGNGDGTLEVVRAYGTGRGPRGIIATDLDGDGLPDVATADERADSVTVHRNLCDPPPACGLGFELALLVPPLFWLSMRLRTEAKLG